MWRRWLAGLVAGLMIVGLAIADDVKGIVKKVDSEKKTITVSVEGGDDRTFSVAQDADIYAQAAGKKNKPGPKEPVNGGLSGIKEGSAVVLSTIKKGDKETAIAIKVEGAAKKRRSDAVR